VLGIVLEIDAQTHSRAIWASLSALEIVRAEQLRVAIIVHLACSNYLFQLYNQ
jgi:hypothetical protein